MSEGVEHNRFHITYDFISHAFRASCRGSSPGNSDFMSQVYCVIAAVRTFAHTRLTKADENESRSGCRCGAATWTGR